MGVQGVGEGWSPSACAWARARACASFCSGEARGGNKGTPWAAARAAASSRPEEGVRRIRTALAGSRCLAAAWLGSGLGLGLGLG